jgi:3-oxoacyl-[acyl-carrier protein] reductase
MDLSGKVAIVTGGGRELGKAAATGLAKAGANVVIAEIEDFGADTAEEISKLGPNCVFIKTDVSNKESVDRMVSKTVEVFGRVDILVNNAAIYPYRPWDQITEEEWDKVFAVNIKGQFLCAQAAASHMKMTGKGKIINLASITFFLGFANFLHYASTKGAVVGFTRTLARELGPDNINVNAISPGAFPTRAEMVTFSSPGEQEAYNKSVLETQCIKRRGQPEDIGNLVCFLASAESDFITGQTIEIDGGWIMH